MSILPLPMPASTVSAGPPRAIRWTVDQFHYLGDLGCFEGRQAMLVDGVILEEGPMNPPHAIAATKSEEAIRDILPRTFHVRVQKPLNLSQTTDPEPDIAVVSGRPGDYTTHPTTAELIVEVSDTSLRYDTQEKMSLYASAGIAEYWVVDVNARQLLVHRDPHPDAAAPFGHAYATVAALGPTDSVNPLILPNARIIVSDILP